MVDYDVLVIGAGPSGSTLARILAERGFYVGILERKKIIGLPLQCAGLVSHHIREVNLLPDEFIINRVKGAVLHSPSEITLKVSKKEPEAYVINRTAYDQYLASIAVEAGAELKLNSRVIEFNESSGHVNVKGKGYSARVIVDARGHSAGFLERYHARQYLVSFGDLSMDTDFVDLKVDSALSPGFLWRIPLDKTTARVGVFGPGNSLREHLDGFMTEMSSDFKVLESYHGFIPVPDINLKLVKGRSILLGDAAGQVKPTTGGGIVLGSVAAALAADAIEEALENGIELLHNYQQACRELYIDEMKNQLRVQRTIKMFDNSDLDHLFLKMKENGVEEIISRYGDMDRQTALIKEFIRRGLLLKIIPSFLSRRVARIWK